MEMDFARRTHLCFSAFSLNCLWKLVMLLVLVQFSVSNCPGGQDGGLSRYTIQNFRIMNTVVSKTSKDPPPSCAWRFTVQLPKEKRPLVACLVQDTGKSAQIRETVLNAYGSDFKELKKKLQLDTLAPFLYTGHLSNDQDSWIFGSINKGGFVGQISFRNQIYYIEKSLKYIEKARLQKVLGFRNDEAAKAMNVIYAEKDLKEICKNDSTRTKRHVHTHAHNKHKKSEEETFDIDGADDDGDPDGEDDDEDRYEDEEKEQMEHHNSHHHQRPHHFQIHHTGHHSERLHEIKQPKHYHHASSNPITITATTTTTTTITTSSPTPTPVVASTEAISTQEENKIEGTQADELESSVNLPNPAPNQIRESSLLEESRTDEEPLKNNMRNENLQNLPQPPEPLENLIPESSVENQGEAEKAAAENINILNQMNSVEQNGVQIRVDMNNVVTEAEGYSPETPEGAFSVQNSMAREREQNQDPLTSEQNEETQDQEKPDFLKETLAQYPDDLSIPPAPPPPPPVPANIGDKDTDYIPMDQPVPPPISSLRIEDENSENVISENKQEGAESLGVQNLNKEEMAPVEATSSPSPVMLQRLNKKIPFAVAADNAFYRNVGDGSIVITVGRILYFLDRVEWICRSTSWGTSGLPESIGFNIQQVAVEIGAGKGERAKNFEDVTKSMGMMTIGFSARASNNDISAFHLSGISTTNALVLVIITVVDSDGRELPDGIIIRRLLKALLRAVEFSDTTSAPSPACDSVDEGEIWKEPFLFRKIEISSCFRKRIPSVLRQITTDSKASVAFCGNGILEPGEDCDCGSLKHCNKSGCCNPRGNILRQCKFTSGSHCYDPLGICCSSTTCQMLDLLDEGLSCGILPCNHGETEGPIRTREIVPSHGRPTCGALTPEVNSRIHSNCLQNHCQSDECSRLDLPECPCSKPSLQERCSTCCFLPQEGCVSSDLAAEITINQIQASFFNWIANSNVNALFNDFLQTDEHSRKIWKALASESIGSKQASRSDEKRLFTKEFCIESDCINIDFLHWRPGGPCVLHGIVSHCDSRYFVCKPNYQLLASKETELGTRVWSSSNFTISDTVLQSGTNSIQICTHGLLMQLYAMSVCLINYSIFFLI